MKQFLHKILFLAILPLLLFSTCHKPTREIKNNEALQAKAIDDADMLARFLALTKEQEMLPVDTGSEFKAMNLALDGSAREEVEAILAQLQPDQPIQPANQKPQENDAFGLDSLLEADKNSNIIENGALLIGVRNYGETYSKLKNLVNQHEGKIESEGERTTDFRLENTFIIRLSPEKFLALADKIRELAVVVREKRLWRQDLSAQFIDLKARLQAKFEAKRRLEQFMRSARNASEVLPIQRELDKVTEEIEALVKTARAMTQKAVYSTITVTFYQEVLSTKPQTADLGSRMAFAAQDGWVAFKEFLVFCAFNWPYIAIGAIFLMTVGLAIRSSRRQARRFRLQAQQQQQQWNLQQQPPQTQQQQIKQN